MRVATVWNDSRMVGRGDVFVAIATDKDDGHRYVGAAFAAGAAAAIVNGKAAVDCASSDREKLIAVADPVKAVQRIAARYRRELGILLIAVTGSSGKTTTRSFIAEVLKTTVPVGETYTNWNNHIGVPLSICRFTGEELAGVIEMGANHTGEISELSRIARPDIALITNIGYAHIGLFGSLAGTTRAKFEIVDGLDRKKGMLLLNGDDERIVASARHRRFRTVYFGLSERCQVRPEKVRFNPRKGLDLSVDGYTFHIPVPGRHFMYSALPAIYLGRLCGVPDRKIAQALAAQKPCSMRGTIEKKRGVTFIVDCYNANPSSMENAVATLVEMAKPDRRVAIIGDMLELGKYAKQLHADLGKLLAESGVRRLLAIGRFAQIVADGALNAGMDRKRIFTAAEAEDAAFMTKNLVESGDVVPAEGVARCSTGNRI